VKLLRGELCSYLAFPTATQFCLWPEVKGRNKAIHVHIVRAHGEDGGIAPVILNLGTRWREWSASRSDRFTQGERALGTLWRGVWVGPQRQAECSEEYKILLLLSEFESWIAGPTACCYTDWAILLMTNGEELSHVMSCVWTAASTVLRRVVVCRQILYCQSPWMVKICVHDVPALNDPQFLSSAEVVWHVMHHCWVCVIWCLHLEGSRG